MKRILLSFVALMSLLCAYAQDELVLQGDCVSIRDPLYRSENGYIYLSDSVEINTIALGNGINDSKEHKIKVVCRTSNKVLYKKDNLKNKTSIGAVTPFWLGQDTIDIYVDDNIKYSIVPAPRFNTPYDKTILTCYIDSLEIRTRDSIFTIVYRGVTCELDKPLTVEWLSLQGVFDKKHHSIRFFQNNNKLYDSILVTEAPCSFELGKDPVSINLDDTISYLIVPKCFVDPVNPDNPVNPIDPVKEKRWLLFWAVVIGIIVILGLKELIKKEDSSNSEPKDTSFMRFWKQLGEQDRIDAFQYLSSTCNYVGGIEFERLLQLMSENQQEAAKKYYLQKDNIKEEVQKLSFDGLLKLMSENQQEAAKKYYLQKDNIKEEMQKLSFDDLILLLTEDQQKEAKQKFLQSVNLKDEIQKLSVEKIIDAISEVQEKQLEERYKTTETIINTVTEKVDVKEMSVDDLYSAMDSNQLMEVVNRYFNNENVSDVVWSVVALRILTTDDVLEKKHAIEIMQEMLNREDDEVWNSVAKVIAGKVNPEIENSKLHYPDTWKALSMKLSDPKSYAVEIVHDLIQKDDEEALNHLAEVLSGRFNSAIENSNLCYPDTWKALSMKLSNPKKYAVEIMQEMLQHDEEEIWDYVAKVIAGKVNPTIENNSSHYPDKWDEMSLLLSNPNVTQFDFVNIKQKLGDTETKLTETEQKLGDTETKLTETEQKLGDTETKLAETEQKLGDTETKLTETEQKLGDTETKLTETEQKLGDTVTKLTVTERELETIILKWIDSMKNVRNDMMSIPHEILNGYQGVYSGDNSVMSGMVDRIINDRRSNLLKFIDKGNAIEIDKNTTMDAIKVSIREMFIEDLGGQYPGWVDIMMRLYAYTKVSFLREDLKKNGLNVDYVTSAAEQTLQLMKLVGIHAVIPELFKSKYDNTVFDLEPIRTIDRIIPSASSHAKSGIVADIYRIGYSIESMNQSKKAIVSIY